MMQLQDQQIDIGACVRRTEWALNDPVLTAYYDAEWGMPVTTEAGLFERLSLEAFQSGLSWVTILKRRDGFRAAFSNFAPDDVAAFDHHVVEQLLEDTRIIRNRRKIKATVTNARAVVALRDKINGGLPALIWSYMPEASPVFRSGADAPSTSAESHALAKTLKQYGFTMVGPTTIYALMSAIGMVDLHISESFRRGCSGLWNRDGTRTSAPAPFSAEAEQDQA